MSQRSLLFSPVKATSNAAQTAELENLTQRFAKKDANDPINILFLGDYGSHKDATLSLLGKVTIHPDLVVGIDLYPRTLINEHSLNLMNTGEQQEKFGLMRREFFSMSHLVLACPNTPQDIDYYQRILANSNKPSTPMLFIIHENQIDLMNGEWMNKIILTQDDNHNSLLEKIKTKLSEMLGIENLNSRFLRPGR